MNHKIRHKLIFTLIILLFYGQWGESQTLNDLIDEALQNNPGILAGKLDYEIAENEIIIAGSLEDPQINISIFKNPMMLPMGNQIGSISGMQMFPWPGALKAREKQAMKASDIKLQKVEITKNELIYKIKDNWYELLELDNQLEIKRELLNLLLADKELITRRISQGISPFVDAIRIDLMIDELRIELQILEGKKHPLHVNLNRLLNRPDTIVITPEVDLFDMELGVIPTDYAVDSNPSIRMFNKQIGLAEAEEEMIEYMKKPMIGAGLQYMILSKRQDNLIAPNTGMDMIMPMATITLPIWTKKYEASSRQTILMQQMYSEMKTEMGNEMSGMVQMLIYDLWKMKSSSDLLDRQIKKLDQAMELIISAYANGKADFEEVLQLRSQQFSYRSEKEMIKKEFHKTLAKIVYLKGIN